MVRPTRVHARRRKMGSASFRSTALWCARQARFVLPAGPMNVRAKTPGGTEAPCTSCGKPCQRGIGGAARGLCSACYASARRREKGSKARDPTVVMSRLQVGLGAEHSEIVKRWAGELEIAEAEVIRIFIEAFAAKKPRLPKSHSRQAPVRLRS